MGLLRSSAMDRSEPSLVPEWLKGTSHNHSFQGGLSRSSSFGNRVHHSPFVGGFGERERESNHGRSYPNFGRGGRFERSERDREVPVIGRGHDWDWSRERRTYDGERFVGDGRFKGHGGFHRLPSGRPEANHVETTFEKKFSGWPSSNGAERSSCFVDRKIAVRTPATVRTSNLVSKLPDSVDSSNHPESEGVVEPPSPSPSPPVHVPKMSEALIHLSSQPPQAALESQRLEEIALKQSRQLVPMKPALPKTMGSSRDKFKQVKPVTTVEPKVSPGVAPYRPPPSSNGTKQLLVLKSKNAVASSPASSGALPSTPKQASGKPKDGLAAHEERKPLVLSQNRSDFFNAIRKKAAANGENRNPQENENENTRTGEGTSVKDVCRPASDLKPAEKPPQFSRPAPVFCGSEEEEMIFLKSLGWVESPEGEGDEALTTEEINSFFLKHPSVALNQMVRNLSGSSLGSPSSSGSGSGSGSGSASGSDSDDESRVRSA